MATRERPAGFRGGIARWVAREEVQRLAVELAPLETLAELIVWSEATPDAPAFIGYRTRLLDEDPDLVEIGDDVRKRVLLDTVIGRAADRRHRAITSYAQERRLSLAAALGTDRTGRALARCPVCDASDGVGGISFTFYCDDHLREQEAEVWEMLGHEPAGNTSRRPLGL